ncbi:MAG: sigma 54-interacting transcriptional regulator [Myxococcota bacterium]
MVQHPRLPEDEMSRLEALKACNVLDTPPERAFDDLTRLAAHICGTPMAGVALVDEGREWFKSRLGMAVEALPRQDGLSAHAVAQHEVLVVPDAQQDLRFARSAAVQGEPHLRFYAGAPLLTDDGHALGALCVMDRVPRALSPAQTEALRALAREVVSQLELRRSLARLMAMSPERLRYEDIPQGRTPVVSARPAVAPSSAAAAIPRARGGARMPQIIWNSAPMREVHRRLLLAAQSDVTVVLTGESGTGKELAAAAIHALSARAERPYVGVNCAAIPETLLESELFGHVKGSFTGAFKDKVGLFQAAGGGTLFLDEVGDISSLLQVKLLRALQEREIRRVGDDRAVKVDVRVIAATNKDLTRLMTSGAWREDFYYRIRVFEIALPPLRERTEDIPLLVEHYIREFSARGGKVVRGVEPAAMRMLLEHSWPGNVRELRNALEHAFVTVGGDLITPDDLPPLPRAPALSAPPSVATGDQAERTRILDALQRAGGNRSAAARLLGTSRVTLWKKMRKLGVGVSPGA